MCCFLHFFDSRTCLALDGLHANLIKAFHKQVAVFCVDDGLYRSTQYLNAIFLQHTFFVEFYTTIECRLSTKTQENTVRTFFLNDALHKLSLNRLEIHRVCYSFRSLNGSNIGVDQHRVDAFFFQRLQSLGTAIIELARLTYFQCS